MALLEIRNLTLQKGQKKIIDDLSLEIEQGKIHAIVGPNGAGKSTLASVIMGLHGYSDFQGDLIFAGKPIKKLTVSERAKLGISLAWQEPARFEGITVEQYLRISGNDASDALMRVGLDPKDYLYRAADTTLSGGERKRIELASIISMKPKLVLLDEPDSGVDLDARAKIFETIRHLKETGTTVVIITHSLDVLREAENAFLLCDGRLIQQGDASEIMRYFRKRCGRCSHKNLPELEASG